MPEQRDGLVIYQAQSPDENALVSASRSFQFAFLVRDSILLLSFSDVFFRKNRIELKVQLQFKLKINNKHSIF